MYGSFRNPALDCKTEAVRGCTFDLCDLRTYVWDISRQSTICQRSEGVLLIKEIGKLNQASSHTARSTDRSVGTGVIALQTSSSSFSPIFGIPAPLSDFIYLTTSMSSRMGRKRTVHLQIYQANFQICEFPNEKSQEPTPCGVKRFKKLAWLGSPCWALWDAFPVLLPLYIRMDRIWWKKVKSKEPKDGHRDRSKVIDSGLGNIILPPPYTSQGFSSSRGSMKAWPHFTLMT